MAMMNGEGPRLVADAQCGRSVAAGDSEALAKTLLDMSKMDKSVLAEMGKNGKKYQMEHFEMDKAINRLELILES